MSTAGDSRGPVSLLEQILDILQQSNNVQTRIGLLMLASNWVCRCTPAVNQVRVTSLEQLSVVVNQEGQRSMKTAVKMFYRFGSIWHWTSKFGCIFRK